MKQNLPVSSTHLMLKGLNENVYLAFKIWLTSAFKSSILPKKQNQYSDEHFFIFILHGQQYVKYILMCLNTAGGQWQRVSNSLYLVQEVTSTLILKKQSKITPTQSGHHFAFQLFPKIFTLQSNS